MGGREGGSRKVERGFTIVEEKSYSAVLAELA